MNTDPRVDAYIAKAAPFAQPILQHVRKRVHAIAPEAQETLKWSMPSFTVDGKILLGMAAFKAHATVGFEALAEFDQGFEAKERMAGEMVPDGLDPPRIERPPVGVDQLRLERAHCPCSSCVRGPARLARPVPDRAR